MKEEKRNKTFIILLLLVGAVATLSIAYAILSTTLNISGNSEINASTWGFTLVGNKTDESIPEYETTGTAITTEPTYSNTTMSYSLTLTKPGDSVTYYFRIKNNGTLPGEIESILHSTPTCTSESGNTSDEELVCKNLIYEVVHLTGENNDGIAEIKQGDLISEDDNAICINNNIVGKPGRIARLTITLDPELTEVSSSTVTVSNLKTEIKIIQTEKTCTPSQDAS